MWDTGMSTDTILNVGINHQWASNREPWRTGDVASTLAKGGSPSSYEGRLLRVEDTMPSLER